MKIILGTKQEMTQIFTEGGEVVPATAVKVEPMVVTAVKSKDQDGYEAVQVGAGERRESRLSRALRGHLKKSGRENYAHVKEFRAKEGGAQEYAVGTEIGLDALEEGDVVEVSGTSKGKGFQGVVKRHGFAGGPGSHGQKHTLRTPGSIGATGPNHVLKGTRMAGRMGGDRRTVKNLKVVKVDVEGGRLFLSGAVPGRRGTLLEIRGT